MEITMHGDYCGHHNYAFCFKKKENKVIKPNFLQSKDIFLCILRFSSDFIQF